MTASRWYCPMIHTTEARAVGAVRSCVYKYIYIYIYMYKYVYTDRERERETDIDIDIDRDLAICHGLINIRRTGRL